MTTLLDIKGGAQLIDQTQPQGLSGRCYCLFRQMETTHAPTCKARGHKQSFGKSPWQLYML